MVSSPWKWYKKYRAYKADLKKLEDPEVQKRSDEEHDKESRNAEERRRYHVEHLKAARIAKKLNDLSIVNEIDSNSKPSEKLDYHTYIENCKRQSNEIKKLIKKVRKKRKKDPTSDGEEAYDWLRKAKQELDTDNPDKDKAYDYVKGAEKILDNHKNF
mgnify:FL=1